MTTVLMKYPGQPLTLHSNAGILSGQYCQGGFLPVTLPWQYWWGDIVSAILEGRYHQGDIASTISLGWYCCCDTSWKLCIVKTGYGHLLRGKDGKSLRHDKAWLCAMAAMSCFDTWSVCVLATPVTCACCVHVT